MKKFIILLITVSFSFSTTQGQGFFCPPCNSSCDLEMYSEAGKCPDCGMILSARTMEAQKNLIAQRKAAKKLSVAVFLQNGAEILDLAGPIEVFSYAGMKVGTVGLTTDPIISQGVLKITPEYSIDNCPAADIVVFVGGNGSRSAKNPEVQAWLKRIAPDTPQFFTVCTGAFFLAEAGMLKGQTVTTFHHAIEGLKELAPDAEVLDNVRYVDNGKIVTTAGVSAGIDGALHLVFRMFGPELAQEVADYMEYDYWQPGRGLVKN